MIYSTVLIIPAALHAEANALGEAIGWGPNNYSVPLSATGAEPATHYGLHTWAEDSFLTLIEGVSQGAMPEGLTGYTIDDLQAITTALIMSARSDQTGHFDEVCAASDLKRIES